MLTQRDRRLIRFIDDFRCATTSQIKGVFYSDVTLRRCQQRLNKLLEYKELKRFRKHIDSEYIYYSGQQPKEIQHMLWRVDAYMELNSKYKLVEFIPEYNCYGIRADAYFEVWQNGLVTPYFLEIQLSNFFKPEKYEKPYSNGGWTTKWSNFPKIIAITKKNINFKHDILDLKIIKFGENIDIL